MEVAVGNLKISLFLNISRLTLARCDWYNDFTICWRAPWQDYGQTEPTLRHGIPHLSLSPSDPNAFSERSRSLYKPHTKPSELALHIQIPKAYLSWMHFRSLA